MIQDEKFCCQSAQNIITNGTGSNTFRNILPVSLLKTSRMYGPRPTGGIWTNFFRPIQKTIVAIAIKIPGMPKATSGLWRRGLTRKLQTGAGKTAAIQFGTVLAGSSSHGMRIVENA